MTPKKLFCFLTIAFSYNAFSCNAQSILDHKLKCNEEFCSSIVCEKLNCTSGQIASQASYCGCCASCIEVKELGEKCQYSTKQSFRDLKAPRCKEGLKCENGKCEAEITFNCFSQKNIFQLHRNYPDSIYAEDLWIPECEDDGSFKAKQQRKSRSICVDKTGKNIFGSKDGGITENITCGCSRYMMSLETSRKNIPLVRPQEHCTASGNFEELQCIGNICYCADPKTGNVKGRLVKMPYRDKLPCYKSKERLKDYLKPCEKELSRTRQLVHRFQRKGINLLGLEKVRCDPDGTFSPKQCDSTKCDCTDESGIRIRSFYNDYGHLAVEKVDMICNCARRSENAAHTNLPILNCDPYGNFRIYHCFTNDNCFCIDSDGEIVTKLLDSSIANETFCKKVLIDLYKFPQLTTVREPDPSKSTQITDDFSVTDYYDDYYSDENL